MTSYYVLAVAVELIMSCISIHAMSLWKGLNEDEIFERFVSTHKQVCPVYDTCGEGPNIVIRGEKPLFCCGFCNCGPDCVKYGTCCLEYFDGFTEAIVVTERNQHECVHLQYISNGSQYNTERMVWMVSKCQPEARGTKNAFLCEHPGNDNFLDSVIPVTDLVSNIHFINKYCAFCSGVNDSSLLFRWNIEIHSDEFLRWSDDNLLPKIRGSRGNIHYIPPGFVNVQKCNRLKMYSISTCNTTGLWEKYDRYLELACAAFIDPFNRTYKNYFCYLCNSPPPDLYIQICPGDPGHLKEVLPPFFALLDVSEAKGHATEEGLVCNSSQFADLKKMFCRDIQCHGTRETEDGVCKIPHNETSTNLTCFSIFLKLTPLQDRLSFDDIIYIAKENEDHPIRNLLLSRLPDIKGMTDSVEVFGNANSRNEFEYVVAHLVVNISAVGDNDHYTVGLLMSLDDSIIDLEINPEEFKRVNLKLGMYDIKTVQDVSYVTITDLTNSYEEELGFLFQHEHTDFTCSSAHTLALNRLYTCPFITLNVSEISTRIDNNVLFIGQTLNSETTYMKLSRMEYEKHDDQMYVCFDTFIEIYDNILTFTKDVKGEISDIGEKQIVSFACVCLSLVCLCITLFTYLKFSVLQSQPGINTIILCFSLLLAQAMYQFGVGQTSVSKWACSLIGAVCHFLWLSVMFSMNLCSVHMFTIFRRHRQMMPTFSIKTTLKSVAYVAGSSLLFVIVNISLASTVIEDKYGGYGGNICYISSNIMQIVAFIVPAALLLVVNILLFSFVVLKISKVSLESAKLHHERNYFLIYARLSTLTGLTWLFGFLNLFLKLEILEYIFIILNAGQGVFIMTAFVMNKRVYSLCCPKEAIAEKTDDNTESLNWTN